MALGRVGEVEVDVKILPVLTRASFHPRDPDLFTEILYGNP
jgi:hypothetical protein